MRTAIVLAIALLIPAARADDDAMYAMGRKAWAGCGACHLVSDPAIAADADWLKLNEITACISAGKLTGETRKAINAYLASPDTPRPLLVSEGYKPEAGLACGWVTVPPTSGTVFLKADRESILDGAPPKLRLFWSAGDKAKVLALPAGNYRVMGYRFYRTDSAGTVWTLSVTDVNGCGDLKIEVNKTATLSLEPGMRGTLSCEPHPDGVKLKLAVRDSGDHVLTLSKSGEISLPELTIAGAKHEELYRGAFENT